MSRLEDLSDRYGEHHRERRSREFVYAGEERVRLFREYVGGPKRRVLDLGCRYGALTRAYAEGNEVTGVDVELLEHVRDPDGLVAEARRVLRPGGQFVASVPNAFRLKNRLRFLLGRKPEDDPTHLHMFSPADVESLLRDFDEPRVHYIAGRFVPLHGALFANDIVFAGRKPR